MLIKRVIYIADQPYSKRNEQRFGLKLWLDKGIESEYWDCSPYMNPVYSRAHHTATEDINLDSSYIFFFEKELINRVDNLGEGSCFIWLIHGIGFRNNKILSSFKRNNSLWGVARQNLIPVTNNIINNRPKLGTMLKKPLRLFHNFVTSFFNHCYRKLISPRPNFVLIGAKNSSTYGIPTNSKTNLIRGHTFDYDIYLNIKNKKNINEKNIVFIDEYLPFHPDYLLEGHSAPIRAEIYYPMLESFFDLVERKTNLQVIIASHPRSDINVNKKWFKKRQVIKGKTAELISESKLVLLHCSAAINFAVMFRKPIVFMTMDEFKNSPMQDLLNNMANILKSKKLNLKKNCEFTESEYTKIDLNAYKKYQEDYIKLPRTQKINNWEILYKYINKLNVN